MSKKILIVCALPQETQNELNDYDVLYTGVGKINASHTLTRHLPLNFDYDLIVNYGTAASLTHSGLVDCTRFIQRDMDATPMGFDYGETPFESDSLMMDFSHIKNPIGKNLCCYTGDSFVTDLSPLDDVVDMEAYALAKTCRYFEKDFVSYKYISDNGNADEWEKNCGKGVKEFKKLLNEIL